MGEPAERDGLFPRRRFRVCRRRPGKKHQEFIVKELLLNENQDFVWSAAVERRPLQPGVQSVLCAGTRLLREARCM